MLQGVNLSHKKTRQNICCLGGFSIYHIFLRLFGFFHHIPLISKNEFVIKGIE